MQVMAAYTLHPAYSENALRLFRRPLPEFYARLDATPGSAMGVAAPRIMTDDDPRFTLAPLERVQKLDFAMLKAALGDALIRNRLEIALVGDLDEEAAIEAVAHTFGALPQRDAKGQDFGAAKENGWARAQGSFNIPHRGEANQLSWRRVWTTTDDGDQKVAQGMDLLARMVTIRLTDELREKLGATYGGGANSTMSNTYPDRGTFSISTTGDPKDLAAIESTADAIVAGLVAEPADKDLFERARKPVLESYADWRRRNETWIGVAAEAQSNPARLDRFRRSEDLFKTITPEYVRDLARKWLGNPAQFTFRALPAETIAAEAGNPNAAN
jgi:zinc protease